MAAFFIVQLPTAILYQYRFPAVCHYYRAVLLYAIKPFRHKVQADKPVGIRDIAAGSRIAYPFFMAPKNNLYFAIDCVALGLFIYLISSEIKQAHKIVFTLNCAVALFANFYLNTTLYPLMASHSGQIAAANYINQPAFNQYHLYSLRTENNVFQFYCKRPVDFIPLEKFNDFKSADSTAFYVNQPSMDFLVQSHAKFRLLKAFENYPQESISLNFINNKERHKVLGQVYLITK